MEQEMNNEARAISRFKPQYVLIGSVGEGTRNHCASEADLTIQFKGLNAFKRGDDAMSLVVNEYDMDTLEHFVKNGNVFDYANFFIFLLSEITCTLLKLIKEGKLPSSFKPDYKHKGCDKCEKLKNGKMKSIYSGMMHTKDCFPMVCHTKLGPCIILPWNFQEHSWVMTADLVPVFNVEGKTLDLVNLVLDTLIKKTPPGWREFTEKVFHRDIVLPEAFSTQQSDTKQVSVGLKLINYGEEDNYIIQPAQEMNVQDFQSNEILRLAYVNFKALKTVLGADVKSYLAKKIFLLPEYKRKAVGGLLSLDAYTCELFWQELLFEILQHPEMRRAFETKIDFSKWKVEHQLLQYGVIPLKK